ncbi:MAG: hypothetical protein RL641_723 [Candidatus Parcubacteria bacterium]|jgi:Tfp pilus assembly protein PilO
MGKFIIPILLVGISLGSYFIYTEPMYTEAKVVKTEVGKLREAETKLKEALTKKEKLSGTYNSIDSSDIGRLEKLMPDNLDNIKLIIDVDRTSKEHGVVLNAVKFDVDQQAKQEVAAIAGRVTAESVPIRDNKAAQELKKDYNSFSLTMSFTGSFANFTNLLSDMEKNLRIIDIQSVSFDAQETKEVYKFEVKAKIYWLKAVSQ